MKEFKCDVCGKVIGLVEETAHIVAFDAYVGIEKMCEECFKKGKSNWKNSNDLLDNSVLEMNSQPKFDSADAWNKIPEEEKKKIAEFLNFNKDDYLVKGDKD